MPTHAEVREWLEKNIHQILQIKGGDANQLKTPVKLETDETMFDGDRFCIRWKATFQHGLESARRITDERHLTFLGFAASGHEVTATGVVLGTVPREKPLPEDWPANDPTAAAIWDRLLPLFQIGVRAAGRPIVERPLKAAGRKANRELKS